MSNFRSFLLRLAASAGFSPPTRDDFVLVGKGARPRQGPAVCGVTVTR